MTFRLLFVQIVVAAVAVWLPPSGSAQTPRGSQGPGYFTSSSPVDDLRGRQAVVETSGGRFVMELLPDAAPNHVAHFVKLVSDGAYAGTAFHRVIPYGMIQGGDPLSQDRSRKSAYGSGGFRRLRAESRAEPTTAGAVAAVLLPGEPDSGGQQFFICATDQPGIQGQYTVFARVVEGLEVVQALSTATADQQGAPLERIEITNISLRDTPVDPFAAATVEELAAHRVFLDTTLGSIELALAPELARETVRAFLQWATAGVYDGVKIHRVVPNFVVQTGATAFRTGPLTQKQQRLMRSLPPEFTDTPNLPGTVSIARGEDPGSGSTSFFICVGNCRSLDGQYTVFARVVDGTAVLDALAAVDVDGETPRQDLFVTAARVVRE